MFNKNQKISNLLYGFVCIYTNVVGESPPITDPLLIPTTFGISVTIIYIKKIIYTRTVSNLIINMNKYFVLKNI